MNLKVKNVRIIDSAKDFLGEVYIENGIIKEVSRKIDIECHTLDGKGKALMPAFVDLHCHFRDPGFEYKEDIESGSKACVAGGYTTAVAMGNTKPICSSEEVYQYMKKRAKEVGLIDIFPVITVTKDFNGKSIDHLKYLSDEIKLVSEDGYDVYDSSVMLEAMKICKEKHIIMMCHCDDLYLKNIDTRASEDIATLRNIYIAEYTGCKIHICHVSTEKSMELIIDAKKRGVNVTCEVTPHHISLNNLSYRVNPSIRDEKDNMCLINAIKDGYVDTISTDHAPHSKEDKEKMAPGLIGLETSFSVSYTALVKENGLSINNLVKIMSETPANILKIKKGKIEKDYEADLVLIDLEKKYKIEDKFYSKSNNTPFIGKEVYGKILSTLKNGKLVYNNGGFDV